MDNKPKWLDYTGQSTSELIGLAGEYRIDSIVCAFETGILQKHDADISNEERTVLAIEALEREVNNGGYRQFFQNWSREYAPIIVRELRKIGSDHGVFLTQNAIDALKIEGSLTMEAVEAVMRTEDPERDEKLFELDQAYYARVGDLAPLLFEFITQNRRTIIVG